MELIVPGGSLEMPKKIVDLTFVFSSGNVYTMSCTEEEFSRRSNGLIKVVEPGEHGPIETMIAVDAAKLDYWTATTTPVAQDGTDFSPLS